MKFFLGGLLCLFCGMAFITDKSAALPALPKAGKWKSALFGLGITALLQSSSAVSCSVCAMRQKGALSRTGARAVLVGSNVGTTLTPFLTAVGLGLPEQVIMLVPIAGIVAFLIKSRLPRLYAPLSGVSLLLWGLYLLSLGAPELVAGWDTAVLYKLFNMPMVCFLSGVLITALVQASSVSIGLLQTAALSFPISRAIAVPFLLGQNIGTTATALLATVGAGKEAKQCARFHFLFNLVGSAWCLPLWYFTRGMLSAPATPMFMALFHLAFNSVNGILHLLLFRDIK